MPSRFLIIVMLLCTFTATSSPETNSSRQPSHGVLTATLWRLLAKNFSTRLMLASGSEESECVKSFCIEGTQEEYQKYQRQPQWVYQYWLPSTHLMAAVSIDRRTQVPSDNWVPLLFLHMQMSDALRAGSPKLPNNQLLLVPSLWRSTISMIPNYRALLHSWKTNNEKCMFIVNILEEFTHETAEALRLFFWRDRS